MLLNAHTHTHTHVVDSFFDVTFTFVSCFVKKTPCIWNDSVLSINTHTYTQVQVDPATIISIGKAVWEMVPSIYLSIYISSISLYLSI